MNKIDKIIKSGLCLGCGLCEAICTDEKCEMKLSTDGFYSPIFNQAITKKEEKQILMCCPAVHVENKKNTGVWGKIEQLSEAWAVDPEIRKKGSSGGVITSLAIYLLESGSVNGVLHVGVCDDSYLYNHLKVSRTKEEIIRNAASRYAPALIFNELKKILDSSPDVYAFIGKPCDIAGVKNFLTAFPQYKNRIKYFLAIFCAGMPSYLGTRKLLELTGTNEEPYSIKYRGDGWPGLFEAKFKNRPPFQISYDDSWGKVLGTYLGYRCKICPDGIGLLADIAFGDSWNEKNGYPDFEESDGRSFVMIRTEIGSELFAKALLEQNIIPRELDIKKLKVVQYYQYQRRIIIGYRILVVQILTGMLLNFKGLGIYSIMWKASKVSGIENMIGYCQAIY